MTGMKLISAVIASGLLLTGCAAPQSADPGQASARQYSDELTAVYKVPAADIIFNVPAWDSLQLGSTQLFLYPKNKFVAITTADGGSMEDPKNAYRVCMEALQQDVKLYIGFHDPVIDSDSSGYMGDLSVYHFEGHVNNTSESGEPERDLLVGYSFLKDGCACSVTGGTLGGGEESKVRSLVDQVTLSVREDMEAGWSLYPELTALR